MAVDISAFPNAMRSVALHATPGNVTAITYFAGEQGDGVHRDDIEAEEDGAQRDPRNYVCRPCVCLRRHEPDHMWSQERGA